MFKFIDYLKTERGRINGKAALFAGISAMFCFAGYELIRSSSESIFLSFFKATDKTYALSIAPVILFIFIYLYGYVLSKLGAKKSMIIYFGFVFITMLFFYFFTLKKIAFIIFLLLVFKEAYVVIASEIYWSYINSIVKTSEARLINGPIAGFGAIGSLLGGYFVSKYSVLLSSEYMILFSSILLIPAVMLFAYSYSITGDPQPDDDEKGGKKGHIHISLLFENKTMFILMLLVFLSQIVSTLSDLNFTYYVRREMENQDLRTAYLGNFWMKVNVISFAMQFFITPFILPRLGNVKYIIISIPLIHFFTSFWAFIHPSLFSASIVFMLFKSFDYSIYKASKEILYIPFSYDARYRIKQIIDAFTYRFSKGFISLFLSFLNIASFSYTGIFLPVIMFVSLLWSSLGFKIKTSDQ